MTTLSKYLIAMLQHMTATVCNTLVRSTPKPVQFSNDHELMQKHN